MGPGRLWSEQVLPRATHATLRSAGIDRRRQAAMVGARGAVLELGFGSGLTLARYPPAVTRVDAVEPSEVAWQLSTATRAASRIPVTRVGLDGQRLALPDDSYDTVASTFTFCTIPRLPDALAEVRRVLRPGGGLHFLEHGLSPLPQVSRWQVRLEPLERRVAGGCELSRDIPRLLTAAGFRIDELHEEALPGPRVLAPFGYLFRGVAR